MFRPFFQPKKAQPDNKPRVIEQRVLTADETISIHDVIEKMSAGQIRKKFSNGVMECGTFDKAGHLLFGIRVHPGENGWPYSQKYEKGKFKNGVLYIGVEYELMTSHGGTFEIQYDVLGRLKMRFKYDSDYREAMLDSLWVDGQLVLKTNTTYMSTRNEVNQVVLQKLYKYLPELKKEAYASYESLNGNYLRKSSEFPKKLLELATKKEMRHIQQAAPQQESARTFKR